MKIDFEGATRVLDLERNITLRQSIAIQEFTGMALFAWQEHLSGFGAATQADYDKDPAGTLKKMPLFSDPAWIKSVAAAHWLMLAQAGEGPPPLDDGYDCDVLGFYVAFLTALSEEVKAKRVPDKPDPTARPARRTPSSRRTKPPASKPPMQALPPGPLPLTGS